jgi:hypothetical protein
VGGHRRRGSELARGPTQQQERDGLDAGGLERSERWLASRWRTLDAETAGLPPPECFCGSRRQTPSSVSRRCLPPLAGRTHQERGRILGGCNDEIRAARKPSSLPTSPGRSASREPGFQSPVSAGLLDQRPDHSLRR